MTSVTVLPGDGEAVGCESVLVQPLITRVAAASTAATDNSDRRLWGERIKRGVMNTFPPLA